MQRDQVGDDEYYQDLMNFDLIWTLLNFRMFTAKYEHLLIWLCAIKPMHSKNVPLFQSQASQGP